MEFRVGKERLSEKKVENGTSQIKSAPCVFLQKIRGNGELQSKKQRWSHPRFYAEQLSKTIQDAEYFSGTPRPGIFTSGLHFP